MRTKVTINLSTDDPLEAELLDMLASINSSHRKQERLRSLLKAGYNMFYKNMAPEQAAMEAFDQHDVALILSLFGQGGAIPQRSRMPVAPARVHGHANEFEEPQPAPQPPQKQHNLAPAQVKTLQQSVEVKKPGPKEYRQITGILDVQASEYEEDHLLDVDPSILEISHDEVHETADIVDPLKKLFSR